MTKEEIARINELAKKKKTVGLTDEELLEQGKLYTKYLAEFRKSFAGQLDNTVIKRPDGSSEPLSDYKRKK